MKLSTRIMVSVTVSAPDSAHGHGPGGR